MDGSKDHCNREYRRDHFEEYVKVEYKTNSNIYFSCVLIKGLLIS